MAMPDPSARGNSAPTPGALSDQDAKQLDTLMHEQMARGTMGLSPISLALACMDWAIHLAASPGKQLQLAQRAAQLAMDEMQRSLHSAESLAQSLMQTPGQTSAQTSAPTSATSVAASSFALSATQPNGSPARASARAADDARFADPAWSQWPYSTLKDSFKAGDRWWQEATQVDGMSAHRQQMVSFFARQWMDAMSPSNWPLTNPQVLTHSIETAGHSLLQGMQLFMRDLQQSALSTTANPEGLAPLPYAVGKDVAVTPGKVVYRNHLIELIQYAPTTDQVAAEPILIIPSPIMKFYILDLSPQNSMVRYLVSQGFTVFMISWRNPDASDRDLGMDDYLLGAVMQAIRHASAIAGTPSIHAMGYCLGGTFLAIVAALMGSDEFTAQQAASNEANQPALPTLASVTLLAAQTDFSEAGELGIFIDDDQLNTLREQIARTGYLSGRQMAGSFQFLHSKDLVWSRNTQRYLMGVDDTGSDLMSWNSDTTRLPQRMHSEYLESLFLRDDLTEGHYKVGAMPIALKNLKMPMMVVGTVRDHVSPWRSVYKIHLHTDTATTFILAAGGHNAGIVSEPGHPRRSYQMDHIEPGSEWVDPDEWIHRAPRFEGSWWEAWNTWLHQQSTGSVSAQTIQQDKALCDAPGEYVMVRYAD
ncbi:MAG: alpha/beta fold hydrolase [Betaproteobacteria bacterium]|nr:alpha/beta fold hydrolase [Betaproteobacteria bacterium]